MVGESWCYTTDGGVCWKISYPSVQCELYSKPFRWDRCNVLPESLSINIMSVLAVYMYIVVFYSTDWYH